MPQTHGNADLLEKQAVKPKTPRMWKIVLHNDDYTPFEFVILMMVKHFNKTPEQGARIAMDVHHKGRGIVGMYPRSIALAKVEAVRAEAAKERFPLEMTCEPEGGSEA